MADSEEQVAVIVPNYNKKKTLRACLESVFAQTLRPAEVIVVDDGSTDGSREIAEEFPCRVVRLPGNQGPAAARNIGVAESSAPLLFFLDSDTALEPDAIENAVRAYQETPGAGMVQGVYAPEPLYDDGLVEQYRVAFEHFDRRQSTATFLSCTLIARHVFEEAGGLDERLRDGEDFEFGTRVPAKYRLVVTETVVTRADDEDRFWSCLWERFVRASTLPVIMMRARRLPRTGETGFRLDMIGPDPRSRRRPPRISSALAATTLLSFPVVLIAPWLLPIWLLLLPAFLIAFLAVNLPFFRFARELKGMRFALFVACMQLFYHASFFFGAGVGLLRVGYEALRGNLEPAPTGLAPVRAAGVPE